MKMAIGMILGFSIMLGCTIVSDSKDIESHFQNSVNMNEVTDIEVTETGALLTFSDGTGYYWEREN